MTKLNRSDQVGIFGETISEATFLSECWQRRPLLIRDAISDITPPLTPDELAGLSCEEDSNARLVIEQCSERNWCIEYGPFAESRFSELPETGWSLLVSDVETIVGAARDIQKRFRFIPDWRHDDIMISYAPDGGSVGAHIDAYDVFLLQLSGTREWSISEHFDEDFIENADLEVLSAFDAEQSWLLEPGDMLYLPPGVAHHGVARGDCMTCSIGFRAPSENEMSSALLDRAVEGGADRRYSDAGTAQQQHPAEITDASLDALAALIATDIRPDRAGFAVWFGEYISASRSRLDHDEIDPAPEAGDDLRQHPSVRFFFHRDTADSCALFVDGATYEVSTAFALHITDDDHYAAGSFEHFDEERDIDAYQELIDMGYLIADD